MNEKKWWESSSGDGSLALTLKGALIAIVPVVIALLGTQGINVDENATVEFINVVFTIIASFTVLIGLGRKIYLSFKK